MAWNLSPITTPFSVHTCSIVHGINDDWMVLDEFFDYQYLINDNEKRDELPITTLASFDKNVQM